ncbi:MAG: hypothetical protein EBR82_32570 [Caulobacteraceae bacterium]|jgi:hypothetical protein|nr:hypothetical protein [Caulobacteraceae bacterium]
MNGHLKQIEANALAVRTKYREELEDARQLLAAPGVQVVAVRRPWAVGQKGRVLGVFENQARVDFDGKVLTVPLSAIARAEGLPDCAAASITYKVAWIKMNSGEFLS